MRWRQLLRFRQVVRDNDHAALSPANGHGKHEQFLTDSKDGKPVVIAGELRIPVTAAERVPAVVIVHGSVGVGDHEDNWAREFNKLGVAAFVNAGNQLRPWTYRRVGRSVPPDRGSCAHALGRAMLADPGGPLS